MFFRNSNVRSSKDPPDTEKDPNVVEIPDDSAPKMRRYDSPGFLLKHPEQLKRALWWTVTHNTIAVIGFLIVFGYLFAELRSFIYLVTNYGFLR